MATADPLLDRAARRTARRRRSSLPGSKSITNRALVCAALAEGTATLRDALRRRRHRGDGRRACRRSASRSSRTGPTRRSTSRHARGGPAADVALVDARLSGTTARFLLPVAGARGGPAPGRRRQPDAGAADGRRRSTRCARSAPTCTTSARPATCPVDGRGWRPSGRRGRRSGATCRASSSRACCWRRRPCPAGSCVHSTGRWCRSPTSTMTVAVMARFGVTVERARRPHLGGRAAGRTRPPTTRSSPTPARRPTSSRPRPLVGGRCTVEGLGRRRCRATSPSSTCSSGWARGRARRRRRIDRHRHRHPARHRGRHGADLRHRPDPRRGGRLRRRAHPGHRHRVHPGQGDRPDRRGRHRAAAARDRRRRRSPTASSCGPGRSHPATVADLRRPPHGDGFALVGLRVPGIRIADPGCVAKTFPGYWTLLDELRSSEHGGTMVLPS